MKKITLFIIGFLLLVSSNLYANDFKNIQNRWKPNMYLHIEHGKIEASPLGGAGWHSAQWSLVPVPGTNTVQIRNRWKSHIYLHIEHGKLEAGALGAPGWHSAHWVVAPVPGSNFVRIKNRWKPNVYLHIEHGKIEASPLGAPGWHSAMWTIKPVGAQAAAPTKKKGVAVNSATGKKLLASTGKQCVKAVFGVGYVAKVRWYDPLMVNLDPVTKSLSLRQGARAVQTDNIAVLGTSCVKRNSRMFAQVSVVGGKFANSAITLATGTVVGIGGAVACVGTAGAACPAAAAAVTGVVSAASLALPDAKETFYLGSPGKLEVTGTVWNPSSKEVREYGRGKPAGASCSADGQCANDTCARDSARDGNKSICCPSGREGLYAGHEYCYGLKRGQTCWSDAMCGGGTECKGNMGGLQRGTCG